MKKGQVTQVFVYVFSIIVVLFVGVLVVRFIMTFSSDAQSRAETQIFNEIEKDYQSVYTSYGSEKVLEYRVSSSVSEVCFISNELCADNLEDLGESKIEDLKTIYSAGDNVLVFGVETLIGSGNIGEFSAEPGGCFCQDVSNGRFEIILENRRNEVFIRGR